LFISFASPKEMNQRKGARKRQPHPFFSARYAGLHAPPKRLRFAPFPVCPRTPKVVDLISNSLRKFSLVASLYQDKECNIDFILIKIEQILKLIFDKNEVLLHFK